MRAGSMDRRIRIETAIKTRSASGQADRTWMLLDEVWSKVTYNDGREGFGSNQFQATAELKFEIYYPSEIDPFPTPSEDIRIVYEGREYDLLQVVEIGRREGLDIFASARADKATA